MVEMIFRLPSLMICCAPTGKDGVDDTEWFVAGIDDEEYFDIMLVERQEDTGIYILRYLKTITGTIP